MASPRSLIVFAVALAMAMAFAATSSSAQNTPQDFVNLHNKARAAVGVGPVTWDAKVARYAQSYAAKRAGDCAMVHSNGPYGENLARGTALSAAGAVKMWVDEKAHYRYNTNSCDPGKECRHYTTRRSTRIGCARVVCSGNRGVFVICSYDPPGNVRGQRPFARA
ncbi:hypothetical protein C2845_PM10G10030 [Panicum miliaceum]|uniref:SCP domain-containing protein n=1 Tax=Panicum miliaceum TaxID=4540 RepID=A0A3L6PEI1_PANMI|nr:hypothetical protein C2845_PM10G10030 [Panicum miliaceum]